MSKIATDLEQALSVDKDSIESAMKEVEARRSVPGAEAYGKFSHAYLTSALKAGKLFFAGAPAWETGADAIEATMRHLHGKVLARLVELLGFGIHVGRKDMGDDADYNHLFNKDKQFKLEAGFEGLRIAIDEEAKNTLAEFLGSQLAGAYKATGFDKCPPHETCHVWDVWYAALAGGSATIYKAGYNLGRKWREEEILNGIFEATERGSDEGMEADR